MNPNATVNRNPAPHPWTTRKAIIISTVSLRHSPMELPKNRAVPMRTAFFGPSLSMSVPATMTIETSAMM